MTTVEKISKSILIGKTQEGEAITLKIETDPSYREEESKNFTISGEVYDMNNIINEETGEERAKEYLEDGELWRDAVEHERTTSSLDEWIEMVLNSDGWQHIIGDLTDIGNDQYVQMVSCGQIDVSHTLDNWAKLIIEPKELGIILRAWKKLHLKLFSKMTEKELALAQKAVEVFKKYESFEDEHLDKLVEKPQYCTDCKKSTVPNVRACENPEHKDCKDTCNECGNCGSLKITENTGIEQTKEELV